MPSNLLQRVAAGDAKAVEETLDTFGPLVWSLARRFCARDVDAEDAVQEIFADVWLHADRFDASVASEKTFIAMIARRRLIDQQRRLGRMPKLSTIEDKGLVTSEESSESQAEVKDEVQRIEDVMSTLRVEQQQALRLSICEGMTHANVAEHLGMPLGTIKTHIRRGLVAIREALARQDGHAHGGTQ